MKHPHEYGLRDEVIDLNDFGATYVNRFINGRSIRFPVWRKFTQEQYREWVEKQHRVAQ